MHAAASCVHARMHAAVPAEAPAPAAAAAPVLRMVVAAAHLQAVHERHRAQAVWPSVNQVAHLCAAAASSVQHHTCTRTHAHACVHARMHAPLPSTCLHERHTGAAGPPAVCINQRKHRQRLLRLPCVSVEIWRPAQRQWPQLAHRAIAHCTSTPHTCQRNQGARSCWRHRPPQPLQPSGRAAAGLLLPLPARPG